MIVTILVLVGHSTYFKIAAPYGGCDYSMLTYPKLSVVYRFTNLVTRVIYLFHMPLFMALSGAVYRLKTHGGGYSSYKGLIVDKAKKLLIPFIVVTLFYSVPIKYISGYFSNSNNILKDIFVGQLLIQGNSHLWFLLALFLIFVIIYPLEKFTNADSKIILSVLFALSFVSAKMPIMILQYTMEYTFWFYVGYCFENFRDRINKARNVFVIMLSLGTIAFILTLLLLYFIPEYPGIDVYDIIDRASSYVLALSGCLVLYAVSLLISRTSIIENTLIKTVRENSFGLYLYSDAWNYVILDILAGMFGSMVFITNIGAFLHYISRIVITFSAALTVSINLKKHKIKYIC